MKKTLLFFFTLFITASIFATESVTRSTTSVAINPSLFCLNGRSTEGPSWSDANFLSLVAQMNPSYVRYPAGTIGNQWNWKTGTFITGYGNPKYPFTIPMLISGLPAGTKINYMVNMVLPTEQTGITYTTTTDAVLATDATLNAKITDILNAMAEFKKYGHVPEIVEIGNELYFTNTYAGVYANNPTFYMTHAKAIVAAIKAVYPTVKIVLCTTKGGTTSRDSWNNTIFNTLNADATFKAQVYGVVQHHYINEIYGDLNTQPNLLTADTLMREGIQYVQESQTDYDLVPTDLKLMLTEYGATKPTADNTWISGIRQVNMALSFMQLGSKIDNLTWHHITDKTNVLTADGLKLGPCGISYMLLSQATRDMKEYSKLNFSSMTTNNPLIDKLYGFHFSNDTTETAIIVNWSNATYNAIDLSSIFTGNQISFGKEYSSSDADILKTGVCVGNFLTETNFSSLASCDIKPYSISTIRVKKQNSFSTIAKDDFESLTATTNPYSNGFPTTFTAGSIAWSKIAAPSTPSSTLWKQLYQNNATAANKTSTVSAFAEEGAGVAGHSQCLKFNITDASLNGVDSKGVPAVVRLQSNNNIVSFNTTNGETLAKYEAKFWARVDGASRKLVLNGVKDTLTITPTWTQYTLSRYVTGTAATSLAMDFVRQNDKQDVNFYMDGFTLAVKPIMIMNPTSNVSSTGFTANWRELINATEYKLYVQVSTDSIVWTAPAGMGLPKTISAPASSYTVTGLPVTNYYRFRVSGTDGLTLSDNTAWEVYKIATLPNALTEPKILSLSAFGGKIYVETKAGQQIELYNLLGVKALGVISIEGKNEITAPGKGIYIVKVGEQTQKVIL